MSYLADTKELGELEIRTVYVYYDIPRFFSCVNQDGQIYIVLSIGETDDEFKWIYVNVSSERLSKIESGEIELRDIFKKASDGDGWLVSTSKNIDKASRVDLSEIPDEVLPKAGQKIK